MNLRGRSGPDLWHVFEIVCFWSALKALCSSARCPRGVLDHQWRRIRRNAGVFCVRLWAFRSDLGRLTNQLHAAAFRNRETCAVALYPQHGALPIRNSLHSDRPLTALLQPWTQRVTLSNESEQTAHVFVCLHIHWSRSVLDISKAVPQSCQRKLLTPFRMRNTF